MNNNDSRQKSIDLYKSIMEKLPPIDEPFRRDDCVRCGHKFNADNDTAYVDLYDRKWLYHCLRCHEMHVRFLEIQSWATAILNLGHRERS